MDAMLRDDIAPVAALASHRVRRALRIACHGCG
jgi:hypothetical protein